MMNAAELLKKIEEAPKDSTGTVFLWNLAEGMDWDCGYTQTEFEADLNELRMARKIRLLALGNLADVSDDQRFWCLDRGSEVVGAVELV